jgi:hypothetical protein
MEENEKDKEKNLLSSFDIWVYLGLNDSELIGKDTFSTAEQSFFLINLIRSSVHDRPV